MTVATQKRDAIQTATPHRSASLDGLLQKLYREQAALTRPNRYLAVHGTPRSITNHVRTFQWYRPFLPQAGRVLDWGCQHAPDSCLLRAEFGNRFDLHSCDFPGGARHRAFHDFAATTFTPLTDPDRLPYPSQFFDVVIGSGVLEHSARDGESLRDLYRVLKQSGVLIVTYLPNWLSIKEWLRRVVWRRDFHRRLYGLGETKRMLLHHGFYPLAARYHTFTWERLCGPLAPLLKRVLPVQIFSSTLCLVARKVRSM